MTTSITWESVRTHFVTNSHPTVDWQNCICRFKCSEEMGKWIGIAHTVPEAGYIELSRTNFIDFLDKLNLNRVKDSYWYENYIKLLGYKDHVPRCKFVRTKPEAIAPSKKFASDEGYDLWLIAVDKRIPDDTGPTIRFDTFIRVQPEIGYHVEILPRSSLSNSGWMLSNSVGLIDSSYSGTLKVCLTKVDPNAKDIELPFKGVQMVLRKSNHYLCEEVEDFEQTARGSGGFGSTN